jgi:hypothetical protein
MIGGFHLYKVLGGGDYNDFDAMFGNLVKVETAQKKLATEGPGA